MTSSRCRYADGWTSPVPACGRCTFRSSGGSCSASRSRWRASAGTSDPLARSSPGRPPPRSRPPRGAGSGHRRHQGGRWVVRLLPRSLWALVAAAVALRTASFLFDILNLDEVLFGLIGRSILDGGLPYVDAIDIKPPLTYLAYTVTGLFGGVSLLPVHLLGVAWLVATCLVLREAARQWTGTEEPALPATGGAPKARSTGDNVGWAAAWIALLASLCEIPSVNSELLMNLPVALALLCAVRAEKEARQTRFDFLCGAS